MAGLICSHSVSLSLVTVIKSDPKNTPVTPSTLKILFASGDLSEFALEGKSAVPFFAKQYDQAEISELQDLVWILSV